MDFQHLHDEAFSRKALFDRCGEQLHYAVQDAEDIVRMVVPDATPRMNLRLYPRGSFRKWDFLCEQWFHSADGMLDIFERLAYGEQARYVNITSTDWYAFTREFLISNNDQFFVTQKVSVHMPLPEQVLQALREAGVIETHHESFSHTQERILCSSFADQPF